VPTRPLLVFAAVVFLTPSGCGPAKLDETKTYTLPPGETKPLTLPAQPRPQRLTVEFEADNPVEVGVYKTADVSDPDAPLPTGKALAIERAKDSGVLSVDLGPDVSTTVTVTALSKQTNVKLHLTNRK
jgi:hypothetical protein